MSAMTIALVTFLAVSLFSTLLILAACVAANRSSQIVSQHNAKLDVVRTMSQHKTIVSAH